MNNVAQMLEQFWPVVLLVLFLILLIALPMPIQARRRGHGFWSWFFLELLAFNPIFPLILVAMLPNKSRRRLRDKYMAELDAKLATSPTAPKLTKPSTTNIERSLGELPTSGTIGELPTTDPQRSIGDEQTRM